MPSQILTLKLDGITAGDYLTWCRDPDPPTLGVALRALRVDADPLGDTITAILDWNAPAPAPEVAATAAGLPLPTGAEVRHVMPTHVPLTTPALRAAHHVCASTAIEQRAVAMSTVPIDAAQQPALVSPADHKPARELRRDGLDPAAPKQRPALCKRHLHPKAFGPVSSGGGRPKPSPRRSAPQRMPPQWRRCGRGRPSDQRRAHDPTRH